MPTFIDMVFVGMVCAAAIVSSLHNTRALIWLAVIVANYFISAAAWRAGLPGATFITGLCDAGTAAVVVIFGKRLWEMVIWGAFTASLLADFMYLGSAVSGANIINHTAYSSALEILNAVALFWIMGVSGYSFVGITDGWAFRPWRSLLGFARFWAEPAGGNDH